MNNTGNIPFHGTWKGEIIDAIVNHKARVWEDFMEKTNVPTNRINRVLKELFAKDALERTDDGEYRVPKKLWTIYKSGKKYESKKKKSSQEKKKKLIDNNFARVAIAGLIANDQDMAQKLSKDDTLFFWDGKLTSAIQKLIEMTQSDIQILNPYIGDSRITQELLKNADRLEIDIVTRDPQKAYSIYKSNFKETHKKLGEKNVNIKINNKIHAKIMIFDGLISVISSMNLFVFSQEISLEAGTVHFKKDLVKQIKSYFWDKERED